MKTLLLGVSFITLVGIGGLLYRNAIEYAARPIMCPVEKLACPDGTTVSRTGPSCAFSPCLPPNTTLADIGVSFALPNGFAACPTTGDFAAGTVACYEEATTSPTGANTILVSRYEVSTSTTPLEVIKKTAINEASGLPVSPASFTSTTLGNYRFTIVTTGRFEGVVSVAYYLTRASDVLRFDATDRGVDWTNPSLDVTTLPTQIAVRALLRTLQGE